MKPINIHCIYAPDDVMSIQLHDFPEDGNGPRGPYIHIENIMQNEDANATICLNSASTELLIATLQDMLPRLKEYELEKVLRGF